MKLRRYQSEAEKAAWKYWREKKGIAPLIIAPTGSGKSVIIASIISKIRKKNPASTICMVTHSRELIQQNFQRLIAFDESLALQCGIVSGTLGNDITHPIIQTHPTPVSYTHLTLPTKA